MDGALAIRRAGAYHPRTTNHTRIASSTVVAAGRDMCGGFAALLIIVYYFYTRKRFLYPK